MEQTTPHKISAKNNTMTQETQNQSPTPMRTILDNVVKKAKIALLAVLVASTLTPSITSAGWIDAAVGILGNKEVQKKGNEIYNDNSYNSVRKRLERDDARRNKEYEELTTWVAMSTKERGEYAAKTLHLLRKSPYSRKQMEAAIRVMQEYSRKKWWCYVGDVPGYPISKSAVPKAIHGYAFRHLDKSKKLRGKKKKLQYALYEMELMVGNAINTALAKKIPFEQLADYAASFIRQRFQERTGIPGSGSVGSAFWQFQVGAVPVHVEENREKTRLEFTSIALSTNIELSKVDLGDGYGPGVAKDGICLNSNIGFYNNEWTAAFGDIEQNFALYKKQRFPLKNKLYSAKIKR